LSVESKISNQSVAVMKSFRVLAVAALVILSYANNIFIVRAGDPDPLQDICVADNTTKGMHARTNYM